MADAAYLMAFTAGALLLRESVLAAELYARVGDWSVVRQELRTGNLLQIRTPSAAERRGREVVQRLENLTSGQLQLLVEGERGDQAALVWLAICKRYRFIHDFAVEIVREKYVRLDPHLTYDDFDIFFNRQAEWHVEVDRIEPSTRMKLRSNLFAMLREADILAAGDLIQPALLSPAVVQSVRSNDPAQLAIFPVSDAQLKEWSA
jgi:hypothetical protein